METAPIVLFVYNRPEHTQRTLESLMRNDLSAHSELYIFADGAKPNASTEVLEQIKRTRELIRAKDWCATVHVKESDKNKGLAASVLEGVTEVINKHGKVIALEDDLILAPDFLKFMNSSLDRYAAESRVACISGYVYPLKTKFEKAFFLKGADCWGWATWKDRWSEFNSNKEGLRNQIMEKGLLNDFTFNGTYPYMEMLEDREAGKNQSWAILWYAWSLLKGRFCLYPPQSLVHNIGNDGSGTHSFQAVNTFDVKLGKLGSIGFLDDITESKEGRKAFETFFVSLMPKDEKKRSLYKKIIDKIRTKFS